MFVINIDSVEFRIWKSAPFTEEQKQKALDAVVKRGYTPVVQGTCPSRFAPNHSNFCTYIAYNDWLNPLTNLKSEWLCQMLPYMNGLTEPLESKTGNWAVEEPA